MFIIQTTVSTVVNNDRNIFIAQPKGFRGKMFDVMFTKNMMSLSKYFLQEQVKVSHARRE
jgi:hypothetical protein